MDMRKLKIAARISLALGIISFISYMLERLAIQDIWNHTEKTRTLEWNIVAYSILPSILFYISALVTCTLLFKNIGNKPTETATQ